MGSNPTATSKMACSLTGLKRRLVFDFCGLVLILIGMYTKEIFLRRDKTLGYEYFMDMDHCLGDKKGRVWYHRHVASVSIGRWLLGDEVVHHIDRDKTNNNPSNLSVMSSSEHAILHTRVRPKPPPIKCAVCGTWSRNKMFCSNKCRGFSCRVVDRPSKEILSGDIDECSFCAIGRKYGVSDNAVRKWARRYGLL